MMARIFVVALLLGGVAAAQRAPIVVELFTSEGCSSCPPADNVLSRLDREQPIIDAEVIPLSEHVDYWNDLGWRDHFSSPLFTTRQQDYGRAFRMDSVYTPQVVVNGQTTVLGSDWNAVTQAIRTAVKGPRAEVKISARHDGAAFEVNHVPSGIRIADMLLAISESGIETDVVGGENGGRRLRHTGVVRSLTNLGKLDTKKDGSYTGEARLNLRPEWNRRNLKLILFVQDRGTRQIIGAAMTRVF